MEGIQKILEQEIKNHSTTRMMLTTLVRILETKELSTRELLMIKGAKAVLNEFHNVNDILR